MRKLLVLMLIVVALFGVGFGGAAAPASPSVTTYYVGTSPMCDFSSIEAAIAAADPGDTIRTEDIIFTENPLVVAKNLTLAGGYPTAHPIRCLDSNAIGSTVVHRVGAANARILQASGADVAISDMVFRNNPNGGGLAAMDGSSLLLETVFIDDNTADWGGGLQVVDSTTILSDCLVIDNFALSGGGGIGVRGPTQPATVTLNSTKVKSNAAGTDGGGLHLQGGSHLLTDEWAIIDANTALGNGGGAFLRGQAKITFTATEVHSTTIESNQANVHGGGIYVDGGMVLMNGVLGTMSGVRLFVFTNSADADGDNLGNGGGIYAVNGATIQAQRTGLGENQAENGGGVYLDDSTLAGDDIYLSDNGANQGGGGIWAGNGSSISLIAGSQVGDGNGLPPNTADNGGGIYAETGSSITLDGSEIGGNEAWTRGGGLYLTSGASLEATNGAAIERNVTFGFGGIEGGGIFADGTDTRVTIDASTVTTNSAITRGGGLYIGGGAEAVIQNTSVVSGNQTYDFTGGGAGAYVSGATSKLTVRSGLFNQNYAATHGGGIYNHGGNVYLDQAYFSDNHAAESGGGLFNDGGMVNAGYSVFHDNEAHNGAGGGLFSENAGAKVDIHDSYIASNRASLSYGGGIGAFRTDLTVQRTRLWANEALGQGTAIYIQGACCPGDPTAEIVNNYIIENETLPPPPLIQGPPGSGSFVYVEGTAATLSHNTLARTTQESFGIYVADGSTVTMTNNIISNFVVGIRRPSGGTGLGIANYTLFHDNLFNYDPAIASSSEAAGDPAFVGMGNYHLRATSDAINAGTDAGIGLDYDRDSRPWDGGFDIGADEYPDRSHVFLPAIKREP